MPPQTTDSVNNSGESPPLEYLFLTKDSIQALKDFQYNDANHSLLYKYYLSPLAGFLVDHATPSTVAPNTIALFGFAFIF
jgi:hypothetical protein